MCLEAVAAGEALPTLIAGVRLLPAVDQLVALQRRGRGEHFATLAAAVWLDAGVALLVQQQRAALPEPLPTGVADERPVDTMHSAVRLQVAGLREAAAAHVTAERPQA